jgi:drug/metabolite transporter (DMT)-like permease
MTFALLAAFGYAAGSVLQARGVRSGLTSPVYLAGLGCDGLAWVLSLLALRQLPTFTVQALLASSLAMTVVLARVFLRSRLRRRDLLAIGFLTVALAVVGLSGQEQPATGVSAAVEFWLCGAAVVVLLGALPRRGSSAVQAVLAGLAYSVAALGARAVTVPPSWWRVVEEPVAWAVVVAGVAGTLAYATALERGPVGPATALLWSVEVVVPAVAGFVVLGDAVRQGWWPATVAALVVVVGSSVVLAGAQP